MAARKTHPDAHDTISRRRFLLNSAAGLGASAVHPAFSGKSSETRPPNLIVIFTDDQGYADLGCYGAPNIQTPEIDRMAREGMRFTDFYSASAVCSPARAALLTGCYAPRVGISGVFWPDSKVGFNPDEITIAELLKTGGYATACIGKWHLGHLEPFLPTNQGFDYFFGLPYSNDMQPTYLLRNTETIEDQVDQSTLTKRYTQETISFIESNQDNPFFIYLPHTMPHVPLAASDDFTGSSEAGLYGDVIEELDWSTGQILQKLRDLGIAENTCVVFTSDNGPWLARGDRGGSADPLRGGKFDVWEGGFRVPGIAWWPGTIPADVTSAEPVSAIDLLPTAADMAGVPLPDDRTIDGKSILSVLKNEPDATSPREFFLYYKKNSLKAVRSGQWKCHANSEMYDLSVDIGEQTNVHEQHTELYEEIWSKAEAYDTELQANVRPTAHIDNVRIRRRRVKNRKDLAPRRKGVRKTFDATGRKLGGDSHADGKRIGPERIDTRVGRSPTTR